MSTFGNKGERERNPNKPKFAALDINSLYRSTRGETFEPATQKNAAPRKHGMQSLGKVPSARRPPANLPSLKAETSIPAISPSQVSNEQQQTTANSASWADSNLSGTQNSTIIAVSSNNINNNPALSNINHNNTNNNHQVQENQLQQKQQQHHHQHHHHHQGASSNNTSSNNNNNNNNSSTWSAVATGSVKEDSALQPPLYQSPQFQNEFPSLDGTLMATTSSGSIQNVNAQQQQKLQNQNSFDSGGGNLNLRPSTDVASWMQQQQQLNSANSGNVRGAGGENGQQGNFQTPEIDGPPKVMALMPSFLRGGNTGIANINSAPSSAQSGPPSQPNYQHHKANMNNNNNNNNNNGMGNRSGRQNNNNNNNNKYDNSSHYNEYSNGLPPRHRQQPPRHYSGRQNNNNNNNNNNNSNNDDRNSFEPEVIVQRPIIKEEELERIDSLARDDAWSKHDEVDYNKKLQFSDDEADDMKMKDDRKIDVWRDSEKREMKQQNGPRSIDPSYIEKMKMVREEEERLERERKVAAQRKLQELEEKSKQQKMQISLDKPQEIEEKSISGINYTINDSDKKIDHQQSQQQQQQQQQTQRDYGKPSKYMNDNKFDMYDSQYGRNNNAGGADYMKKTTFQSNLPPRFQKQQQYGDRLDDRREKGPQNNYKPLHQQDSKNIPFIQHPQSSYDQQQQQQNQQQRWMQYNKGNQQGNPPRRNMSSLSQSSSDDNRQNNSKQPYNTSRRRQESEEDDYGRFIKESTSTGSLKKSQTVPSAQISRSMSDSSDKLSDHNRSEKSTSREFLTGSNVCWAEVCENDKRSSLDAKEKRRVSESSAISDDQPRTILQRNKPLQEQLAMKENVVKKESSKEIKDEEQKTVLSEQSPPKDIIELEKKEKVIDTVPIDQQGLQSKKSLDIIPEKEQNIMAEKVQQLDNSANNKDVMKSKDMPTKDLDDSRHSGGSNKRSPHSNRYEPSMRGRGNSSYGGYRGNWQRRGNGGHSRSGRYDYSDSENSEEYDQDSWNRKPNRKDINRRDNYGTSGLQKEGFSPRGEPSRRGRGGGSSMTTSQSNFRRTGSNVSNNSIAAPVKRIDNYGPPSSKSPFSTSDEKSGTSEKKDGLKEKEKLSDDDRMKQKQKALSDGLINKNMKDNSNLVMQKSSSPTSKSNEESANKQHSNDIQQPITQSASSSSITQQQDIKKESIADEKNAIDGKNRVTNTNSSVSQSSYNSRQQQQQQPKFDNNKSAAPINKSMTNKPSMNLTQQSSTGKLSVSSVSTSSSTVTTTVAMTSQTSTTSQYNNSGLNSSKQIDSRNSSQTNNKYDNSNNYRDSRSNDPRNNGNGNRMAPRFAKQQRDPTSSNQRVSGNYWDKNNAEGLNDESNKVSLMQQLNASNSSGSLTNQQVSTTTNNSNVLKTDMIKQQQQQQQQQNVGQQSQQNPQNQSMTSVSSNTGNQPMLDGASLPKQTLIFENTSYKSAPPSLKRPPQLGGPPNAMNQHPQKDSTPTINEMIEQQAKDHSLTSALQNLSFGQKSDIVDMNSFKFSFDTQLTDDGNAGGFGSVSGSSTHPSQVVSKASSLGLVGAKTGMQNSNILNTDALNMKVASCKKVWEEPSVEHSTTNADDVMANFVAQQQLQHYAHNNINHAHHTGLSPQSFSYAATSSANDHASSLEHFNKANDNDDSNSYQSQHMSAHVMHSQNQQANLNMKAAEAFATQNANVCKVKPTQMHQSGLSPPPQMQQNPLQQHQQQQFYQTPSYANMPTIPSPPVVYNSAQATAGGLYNPYNMDAARAQMYSYPQSATNNSLSFNAFMQTPNIASAPTHEMYQNLSQYRATVQPYNQTPQLNNPNAAAVLISSATPSNSMMSSKSNTPQQIGAIGSKSSAPQNAPTATASQYNQQQYMNHLYHQNSYYPSSTAQQANPYYNTTGNAATGNYGMFGGTTSAPPQQQMNYGSVGQFPLNSQMLNNLVINQQYRSGPVVAAGSSNSGSANSGSNSNTSGYMKQQQQHQSQLQDPAPIMKFSSMNESHSKSYNNNWDISPSLSYNSNSYNRGHSNQNYNTSSQHQSSQRMPKVVNNNSNQLFPNLSSSSQGKSQFYGNNSSQPGSK